MIPESYRVCKWDLSYRRALLPLLVILMLSSWSTPTLAQTETPPQLNECDDTLCEDVFNSTRVTVTAIRALSTYAYFQNPLLEADVTFEDNNSDNIQLYMPNPQRLGSNGDHCDLVIVGLADSNDELQTIIEVDVSDTPARIKLLAFCQRINLPGIDNTLPFPKQSTTFDLEKLEIINHTSREGSALVTLINTVLNGTCMGGTWGWEAGASPSPTPVPFNLNLKTLATQFAIFIYYADDQRDMIWKQFLEEAQNRIYERDYEGIYDCLLAPLSIGRPVLPTTTPSPTPVVEPTITPTPVPEWDKPIVRVPLIGQMISPLAFIIVTGLTIVAVVLGIVVLSISRFRRYLFAAIIGTLVALGIFLLFGQQIISSIQSIFGGAS